MGFYGRKNYVSLPCSTSTIGMVSVSWSLQFRGTPHSSPFSFLASLHWSRASADICPGILEEIFISIEWEVTRNPQVPSTVYLP